MAIGDPNQKENHWLRIVVVIPSVARKYSGKHVDMSYNIPSGYDEQFAMVFRWP